MNPNFPTNLDIRPSVSPTGLEISVPYTAAAQQVAICKYGIAGRVWEAAYAMSSYINPAISLEFDPPFLDHRGQQAATLLELGSGSGLVALHLSNILHSADRLIVTDLPEVCPLLEENLANAESVEVHPLAWGNTKHAQTLLSTITRERQQYGPLAAIICSDLVYFPELLAPLLRTLIQLSTPSLVGVQSHTSVQTPTIYISYKIRSLSKETPFWSALGLWFEFIPVLVRKKEPDHEWIRFGSDFVDTTFLFIARRRPDSYNWQLPAHDHDLLAGVGALGTDTPKVDDTFENLLLMSMPQD